MTSKARKPVFACTACGAEHARWVGRCPQCQGWGTVEQVPTGLLGSASGRAGTAGAGAGAGGVRRARRVSEVDGATTARTGTGLGEFDRVVGGGLVPGQVVLLAGEPGVGKSTLLLEVAHRFALGTAALAARERDGAVVVGPWQGATPLAEAPAEAPGPRTVLYVSGEESAEQLAVRARRTGVDADGVLLADEQDLHAVLALVEEHDPDLVVVDSVQTVASSEVDGRPGGTSQVQHVTQVLTRMAKSRPTPLLLVGQSTKDSSVAGPRALEHLVDTVLTFEGDRHTALRLLRASKNRFGPADEVACFEQADDGLREVVDPSELFRGHREEPVPGTCVTVAVEGRRPLLAEVQALVTAAATPNPRRGVSGLDASRTAMLLAVTERAVGLRLGDRDVFVATVGGARLVEPGADLAVALALASAAWDAPLPADVIALGEVTLSGDVRAVPMLQQRVAEAVRLGYRRIVVPTGTAARVGPVPAPARLREVSHVTVALAALRDLAHARAGRP
ncbi:DNA repair protein RadA [Aquipuribacter nitratireducens]|uniref:DNA repair protein RadA n=1 Tax=Aquipuribacter nitratireducens TaxID=650104 RepID=A0ABW0GSN8_9MICO